MYTVSRSRTHIAVEEVVRVVLLLHFLELSHLMAVVVPVVSDPARWPIYKSS